MKHNIDKISETSRSVRVEIPIERVTTEFEKVYRDIMEKATIPGFRRGKVPRSVLKLRLGEDIANQIGIDLIKETLPEALKSIEEQTVGSPEFNEWKVEEGQPFTYEARIEVLPPFDLKDYKGIEVPRRKLGVSDEEIAAGMERIRAGQTTYEVVSGRAVLKDDRIYGRITLTIDGQPMPGWTNRHIDVEIGKNTFFPDSSMEASCIGAEAGNDHAFTIEFPPDYAYYRDVAGKSVAVLLRVNEIKTKRVPEIDDDLAKDLGLENVDELKQMVAKDIERKREGQIAEEFEAALMDKIASANAVPAPGPMIDAEAEFIVENYFSSGQKISDDQKAQFQEMMRPMAEKRIRHRLILQRVAELESVDVTEEDISKAFDEMAEQEETTSEEIRQKWEEDDLIDNLKRQIKRSKALEWLKQNAVPVDAPEPAPETETDGNPDQDASEPVAADSPKGD